MRKIRSRILLLPMVTLLCISAKPPSGGPLWSATRISVPGTIAECKAKIAAAARQIQYDPAFVEVGADEGMFTLRHPAIPIIVNGRCNARETVTLSIGLGNADAALLAQERERIRDAILLVSKAGAVGLPPPFPALAEGTEAVPYPVVTRLTISLAGSRGNCAKMMRKSLVAAGYTLTPIVDEPQVIAGMKISPHTFAVVDCDGDSVRGSPLVDIHFSQDAGSPAPELDAEARRATEYFPQVLHAWQRLSFTVKNANATVTCLGNNLTGTYGIPSFLTCEGREGWKSGRGAGFHCDDEGCQTFGKVSDYVAWNDMNDTVPDGHEIGLVEADWGYNCTLFSNAVVCLARDNGILRTYTLDNRGIR